MYGVFVFPANPTDKEYPYKKDPKKPLKLTDEELVHFVKITPKMAYFCHCKADYDKASPEEKVQVISRYADRDYTSFKKMRGIEDAYQTDDGEFYLKIITKEKDWFTKYFV